MALRKRQANHSTQKGYSIKKIVGIVAAISLLISLLLPGVALADVSDFTVTNFSADYYLSNSDPQGSLHVVEHIAVDYTDQNHGILRALPATYKGYTLQLHVNKVSSPSGAPTQYTTYGQNGNTVLKIGDPNRTVTGSQHYDIDYTYHNVIGFYRDHDELYWNANGDQWPEPFGAVSATLHLPTGLHLAANGAACFVGSYGATNQCQVALGTDTVTYTASNLAPYQTLTFVAGFPKGYFTPMGWQDYARDYIGQALQVLLPLVAIGGAGFVWWFKRGRDAKGTGVIIPQYDAPDNLTPLEVGAVLHFQVSNRDLTATIIDLAIRKYLRIVEEQDSKLLVLKQKSFRLELLNQDWSKLNLWEQQLMRGIFGANGENPNVTVAFLADKLQTQATYIKNVVVSSLTDRGYFVTNPGKYLHLSVLAVGFFAIYFFSKIQGFSFWMVGVIAGLAVFAIFYHFMPARTAKGVAAKEHIEGLKLYLSVAEKDRLKMLQSPDAPYAPPAQTVQLFETLLPYAIVLGVEEQWAKKFENIYSSPPSWYSGNMTAFNTGYLVGSLGSGFNSAMGASFAAPRSAGSSGFGGGGFAGGGGGGGGGGGW